MNTAGLEAQHSRSPRAGGFCIFLLIDVSHILYARYSSVLRKTVYRAIILFVCCCYFLYFVDVTERNVCDYHALDYLRNRVYPY